MRGQWLLSTLTKPNFNLVSCVTKRGHVGWQGPPLPNLRLGQLQVPYKCVQCLNTTAVQRLLRGPPGQGRPSFPCPGACVGRVVPRVSSEATAKAWAVSATSCEKGNSHQTQQSPLSIARGWGTRTGCPGWDVKPSLNTLADSQI